MSPRRRGTSDTYKHVHDAPSARFVGHDMTDRGLIHNIDNTRAQHCLALIYLWRSNALDLAPHLGLQELLAERTPS